ncbi:hypothetical protein niasHT_034089 [Heterodera trifolii]|uniref:Citrate transport protein n=1 Tax=Heterodera trifolii TaxID=157864 RepID=A0ABD2I5E5_9BILA
MNCREHLEKNLNLRKRPRIASTDDSIVVEERAVVRVAEMRAAATDDHGEERTMKGVVIGGITGGIEICITYPTEYVKTQLQLDERSTTPKFKVMISRTFRLLPRTVRSALRFHPQGHAVDERGNLSPFMRLACGLGAGISEAIFAVTPMETVKVKFIHDQTLEKPRFRGFLRAKNKLVGAVNRANPLEIRLAPEL